MPLCERRAVSNTTGMPRVRLVEFIDENGGGAGGASEQTPVGGHGHPFRPAFLVGLSRVSADISIPIIAT